MLTILNGHSMEDTDITLINLLFKATSAWRSVLNERLKPLGLSQAKWRTLMHIERADKPFTQKELASKLGIEGASLVGLLDRLEKDEWIERKQDASDRRVKKVYLTKKSRRIISKIKETSSQLKKEILDEIPKKEYDICMNILAGIKERLEKAKLK